MQLNFLKGSLLYGFLTADFFKFVTNRQLTITYLYSKMAIVWIAFAQYYPVFKGGCRHGNNFWNGWVIGMRYACKRILSVLTAAAMGFSLLALQRTNALRDAFETVSAASVASEAEWGMLSISGGGFVSGLVAGKSAIYCRTDVGGAYRLENGRWKQLMGFVSEEDRGFLSVEAMAVDPEDDNILYLLCGCNYFSSARTAIFRSEDGGNTFTEYDVSDYIRVHGNGYGRHQGERVAIDPNDTDIIYVGGRTGGLIKSTDAGKTWTMLDALDVFDTTIKWPEWDSLLVDTTPNGNGIPTVLADRNSNLYVGVSVTGTTNVYVSKDGGKSFKALSDELPTDKYPARMNLDADGNILICYQGGISFNGTGGAAYRYNTSTGALTDISIDNYSIGQISSDPKDSQRLVATTCGVWNTQLWGELTQETWEELSGKYACHGDIIYTSIDGGQTWEAHMPGQIKYWDGPLQADYLDSNGCDWIFGKAIHWSGSIIINPNDIDQIFVTSGNGVFACDNIWDELPKFYFSAEGIEEVVALDLVSVPGGSVYSAIGDYDGFIHPDVNTSIQYQPNIGSTSGIAYCPSNTKVMMRVSENNTDALYSLDGGNTWTAMNSSASGGKCAITKLSDGKYRFFRGNKNSAHTYYSDDFGATWSSCGGITNGKTSHLLVDSEKPNYVYAYTNVTSYSGETTYYYLYVSSDYGATFSQKQVEVNDMCADMRRIAQGESGQIYCPLGWYGLKVTNDYGDTFTKLESVVYCEAVSVGAAKDASSPGAIYIWGWVEDNDAKGIYRSNDNGKTWTRINDDAHEYGGLGNGNFIVADQNEYGTFYMSSVGVGIVYCKTEGSSDNPQPSVMYGDIYIDQSVNLTDLVLLARHIAKIETLNSRQMANSDVFYDGKVDLLDLVYLAQYIAKIVKVLGPAS